VNNLQAAAPLKFLLKTFVCQLVAVSFVIIGWHFVPAIPFIIIGACVVSYSMAVLFSLSKPWRVVNLLIPLSGAITLFLDAPSWIFLIVAIALFLIYAPAFVTRVPYYPTPRPAYDLILAELPTDRPFVFLDIGCGFGDLLSFLSKRRPYGRFVGIEIGVLPWLIGWMRTKTGRYKNLRIHFKNMWKAPLDEYDFVYTFLSPAPMVPLWHKAQAEMQPGSLFISNTFQAPAAAERDVPIDDRRSSRLFMYRMSGRVRVPETLYEELERKSLGRPDGDRSHESLSSDPRSSEGSRGVSTEHCTKGQGSD